MHTQNKRLVLIRGGLTGPVGGLFEPQVKLTDIQATHRKSLGVTAAQIIASHVVAQIRFEIF